MPNILQYKNMNCTTLFNAVTSGVFSAFHIVHSPPLSVVQKGDNRQELDRGVLRHKHWEDFTVFWRMGSELNMILMNWRHDPK